ncbi:MAG: glycoside hydrolase family 3 C-terminal domain-containing protein [Prolixibacteraceae bacterium]
MKFRLLPIFGLAFVLFAGRISGQEAAKLPYQNTQISLDERVEDLVSRMTLKEKVTQLFNQAEPIERLGVPAYNWWNECLHGVARAGKATVFPQAIGLSATFDQDLMFRVGDAISDEARAKYNFFSGNNVRSIYTGLTFWTPNINIFRDPRWGRGQETYGEDPFLTGRMAVNFIKGLQGSDPKYLKTVATAKHYAVHSGPEFTRHTDNIFVNDRDLYDTYLPAFKAVIRDANVQSVMCAYNRFRDKPCCGNDILLGNILRNRFGFNGYVVSDCGAISDFYTKNAHHVVPTSTQAWGWSLSTGTDLNCEQSRHFLVSNLDSAIRVGMINESDINTSVRRLFKARFKLGLFDPDDQVAFSKIPFSVVGSEKNLKLSQEAAEKSLVLLKNNGILPLKNTKRIALIGPNANNFAILIGNYNGQPIHPVTPLKALRDKLGAQNVLYTPGCPIVPGVYTDHQVVDASNLFHNENGKLKSGLKAEYFDNTRFQGNPKLVRIDPKIDFYWAKSPVNNLIEEQFSVRWSGILIPNKSATYQFGGNVKVKIDNKGADSKGVVLEKGKKYEMTAELRVSSSPYTNSIEPSATLSWTETSRDYRKEALDAAAKADVVVFCGGISADLEGEEMPLVIDGFSHGDRTHINLPQIQEELLKDLHKTGKPIVFVNFSGSAMAMNWEEQNLPAIVQGFYPGETTGIALTRLLFGDFNPSGRLPVTFYKSEKDIPDFSNYDMQGRTYRYFKGTPLYYFGFGLSYTNYEYSNLKVDESASTSSSVKVTVDVKNAGKMDGEEVVQLYVSNKSGISDQPIVALKSFQRICLNKGEQKTVTFLLKNEDFSLTNSDAQQVVEPGTFEIAVGGSSPDKKSVVRTIKLTGKTAVVN